MDFGKVKDTRNIDFTLPPDDPATARVLPGARAAGGTGVPENAPLRVHVGCPVWQDDAMARKLCPPGTAKARRLACYSRQFNAIELNSTGYGLDAGRIRQWAAETPAEFRFCPKVPMDVTHVPNLDGVWERYAAHAAAAEALGSRLGFFFLQFPEAFEPYRFAELERFLASQAKRLPLALEVRHRAWFEKPWKDRLWRLMEEHGVTSIITDTPGRRDALHQRLTGPCAFIRFNGHALGPGDFLRLEAWAERIRSWMDRGLRELYFFTHIDPVGDTVDLAAHFIWSLKAVTGLSLPEPRLGEYDEPTLAL